MLPLDSYPRGTISPGDFISGSDLHDIAISGPGIIDGKYFVVAVRTGFQGQNVRD